MTVSLIGSGAQPKGRIRLHCNVADLRNRSISIWDQWASFKGGSFVIDDDLVEFRNAGRLTSLGRGSCASRIRTLLRNGQRGGVGSCLLLPACGKLRIGFAGDFQDDWLTCGCFVPTENDVDVERVELDPVAAPSGPFSRNEG